MMNPTSLRSSTLYDIPHVCIMAKEKKKVAKEVESESYGHDELDQHVAHLRKKNKLILLKLTENVEDQEKE